MTRVQDLVFVAADCCAFHQAATVRRADGVDIGLIRSEDGKTFTASLYGPRGLLTRHVAISAMEADKILQFADTW